MVKVLVMVMMMVEVIVMVMVEMMVMRAQVVYQLEKHVGRVGPIACSMSTLPEVGAATTVAWWNMVTYPESEQAQCVN